MAQGKKDVPELVRAAEALERELSALEALSRSVRKIHLDSEKSIGRAVKELGEALALPERLGEGLRALGLAMERMQARQQAALEPLAQFAVELQTRSERLNHHVHAYAALGQAAGALTARIQSAAPTTDVDAELSKIVAEARALVEAAREDDFPEVGREADALRQRLSSLRGRLDRTTH